MLHPKLIHTVLHQVNMDRNLNLSKATLGILSDVINNAFRYADTPEKNIADIQEQITENQAAGHRLVDQRDKLKSDCQHVWLRQMYSDSPYTCSACKTEVSL